jgi:hypothetical protein
MQSRGEGISSTEEPVAVLAARFRVSMTLAKARAEAQKQSHDDATRVLVV